MIRLNTRLYKLTLINLIFSSIGEVKVTNLPVLGEMGTAGFGAELEHNLPILVGGFRPEGFGRDDGLGVAACSGGFMEEAAGVAVVLEASAAVGVNVVAVFGAAASGGTVS